MKQTYRFRPFSTLLFLSPLVTGCAGAHSPDDPFEPVNRQIYKFNDAVDKAVVKPVAKGYNTVMPSTAKTMLSNFFSNLDDVVVAANDFLQFKFVDGFSDCMRVFVNTTIGAFGLIDVASANGLKKHNEDFGQTLGKWGIGGGPYLVLPILGPSTVRDSTGLFIDGYVSPMYQLNDMSTRNQSYIVRGINTRAGLLDQEKVLEAAMIDPYQFMRDSYLLYRKNLVYDGNPPRTRYEDLDDDSSQ
jgi:phospholipid-binding lipoprotein MlaA